MLLNNEAQVRAWLAEALAVSRETLAALDMFAALLRAANTEQNLIAASTAGESLWVRHIADSAQLVPYALDAPGDWLDIGSGPGLPGLVVALLEPERQVTLVESRRLRCEFLRHCSAQLGIADRVYVVEMPLSRLPPRRFSVISARAFAPLPKLLAMARPYAGPATRWLLPKGCNAQNELSSIDAAWQKRFHVEQSLTDVHAAILIGDGVPPEAKMAKARLVEYRDKVRR
jgi:16S rRNA (guanine527-N7)-methyltransferase